MKMYPLEVTSKDDLIFIKQQHQNGGFDLCITLNREQAEILSQWIKNEYCAYRNGETEINFPDEKIKRPIGFEAWRKQQ